LLRIENQNAIGVTAVLEYKFSGNPTHNGKKVTDMKRLLHDGFTRKLS